MFFFFSECVSFPRKINNLFWEVTVFQKKKVTIFIGRETKTHILPTKINGKITRIRNEHDKKTQKTKKQKKK